MDAKHPDPGRVTVRRLNQVEYRHTIRDLLGVDFDTSESFPADDTGHGFDNLGDVLSISPLLLEKYVNAAQEIVSLAVPTSSAVIREQIVDGDNRSFDFIGISEGHHDLTHHQNRQERIEKVDQIDHWYVRQFAKFIKRLKEIKDVDGNSLLHKSMVLFGSGNADGNKHTHTDLPILLAGSAGGRFNAGRFLDHAGTPLANLYLTMAEHLGIEGVNEFGDSTGKLRDV